MSNINISVENVKRESFHIQIKTFYKVIMENIAKEKFPHALSQFSLLKLRGSFPYRETSKIQKEYQSFFQEDWCLNGDLNTYWMNIAGSVSYLIKEQNKEMQDGRLKWLSHSFFQQFPNYKFLEEKLENYPIFYQEYMEYEKARILILYYLSLKKGYSLGHPQR